MKSLLITLMIVGSFLLPFTALQGTVAAACGGTPSDSKNKVLEGIGETGSNCKDNSLNSTINAAVNIISIIAGVAGIIMVILSGFRYITSGGDSGKIATAKNTLIYAVIGLAVAALAQVIVHLTLSTANGSQDCPGHSYPMSDPRCKP